MNDRTIIQDYINKTKGCGIYTKYPDISDRSRWEGLSDSLKKKLVQAGEEAMKEPWTQLLISDFMEFKKSGNRVRFEDKYFPRRRKLNKLVLAECVENKGRFLGDILDGLYLILEETTWCLPPHTSYVRDGVQENMPDVTRPIIDLFDAESGAEVAFAEYALKPVLNEISPFISTYVNERLKERIFTPYLEQHFWWMGNGKESMCNWTPWCTQNVLICALTRPEGFFTEEERRAFVEKAAKSCDYFLDEYGEDGGCDEGAQYYSHAALCLFGCLELMSGVLGNGKEGNSSFADVFKEKLIRNVANYIVKMYVGNGYYVNFADCSALAGGRTAREYLFGKATGDKVLSTFAALDFQKESEEERLVSSEINLFYHFIQAFAFDEMMSVTGEAGIPEDAFFESVGLMVARDGVYSLAAKAGDNADSHNHNDVGSFTIYKNGKPMLIDLGVGTYTQKTFSDRRYELWTMQSQFHNLPTFIDEGYLPGDESGAFEGKTEACGKQYLEELGRDAAADVYNHAFIMQHAGEQFAAGDVNCILCMNSGETRGIADNSADEVCYGKHISSLAMDIAGAYGDERIRSYKRIVSLNKGEGVCVEDTYDGDLNAVISLMTYEKPEIVPLENLNAEDALVDTTSECKPETYYIKIGDLGYAKVEGVVSATVKAYPITDERLSIAWKHEVYRVLLEMGPENKVKMSFR